MEEEVLQRGCACFLSQTRNFNFNFITRRASAPPHGGRRRHLPRRSAHRTIDKQRLELEDIAIAVTDERCLKRAPISFNNDLPSLAPASK
ncbi:hypothetical protein EYF80_019319 [Liparis tanakae]|uniref:Uncharacterized protein n=1 Tax=Liparis tanakae TaxID=230148 RepID=A0A4Z2HZQ1_9TELE|nr:hypothetical protein EYF80_019319 [Liparis tanakae]